MFVDRSKFKSVFLWHSINLKKNLVGWLMSRVIVHSELEEPVYLTTGQNYHQGNKGNRTPSWMKKERGGDKSIKSARQFCKSTAAGSVQKNAQVCRIKVGSRSRHKEL